MKLFVGCPVSQLNAAQLEQDAQEQAANQAARFSLADITALGEKLEELKLKEAAGQALLNALSDEIRELETVTLPDGLKNLGIKEITLASGAKISLIDVISASITDENREAAHAWLREHGHGDIIKNNLTLTFGKGEDEIAKKLMHHLLELRDKGETKFGDLQQKESVHPSTLKAFVKDQLSKGAFPGDLFKLYTGQAVKFK